MIPEYFPFAMPYTLLIDAGFRGMVWPVDLYPSYSRFRRACLIFLN